VTTSTSSKENVFGYTKLLLQQGRLDLPNHPELLKQLRGLQFEVLPSGGMRIAVPERLGHDDLAMAFAMAVSAVMGLPSVPADHQVYDATDVLGEDLDDAFAYLDDGTGGAW
jgi:hypothetical protein